MNDIEKALSPRRGEGRLFLRISMIGEGKVKRQFDRFNNDNNRLKKVYKWDACRAKERGISSSGRSLAQTDQRVD